MVLRKRAFEVVPLAAVAHLPVETEPEPVARKTAARILSVSYDEQLSLTREKLLAKEGYEMVSVLSLDAAIKECDAGKFDLAILCHTVRQEDKKVVIDELRKRSETPVLVLYRHRYSGFREGQHSFDTGEGPAAFLRAVGEILTKQTQKSEGKESDSRIGLDSRRGLKARGRHGHNRSRRNDSAAYQRRRR